jgi:hypothetical protein
MEEIHKLDRLSIPKCSVVNALWLVIELDLDGEDFGMF